MTTENTENTEENMKIEIITRAENDPVAEFFSATNTPETDDARADLAEEMKFHHRTHAELVQTQCQLQDAIRERDEAIKNADYYRERYEQLKDAREAAQ